MRIGFDARMIDHPGIGRYIRNILFAMLAAARDDEFLLFGDPFKLKDFPKALIKKNLEPIYSFRQLVRNPFDGKGLDVIHVPHFNVPFGRLDNLVVTVHDLIYLKIPESRLNFLEKIFAKKMLTVALKKAKRIIAVSLNTKKDIIEYFPWAASKIEVVYEAADPEFRIIEDEKTRKEIKDKYSLPNGIILCVGSLRGHKNIERLLESLCFLKKKNVFPVLALVGKCKESDKDILRKSLAHRALYLGEVPREDLVVLYNLADILVLPSLYEGFGLPVLEAMACGTPVAASKTSSIPEIAGNAALLFDPRDAVDMAEKIYTLLTDSQLRKDLREKGLKQARAFLWDKAAIETMAVYRRIKSDAAGG